MTIQRLYKCGCPVEWYQLQGWKGLTDYSKQTCYDCLNKQYQQSLNKQNAMLLTHTYKEDTCYE